MTIKSLFFAFCCLVLFTWQSLSGFSKNPYIIYSGINQTVIVIWQLDAEPDKSPTIRWGEDENFLSGTATVEAFGDDHLYNYLIRDLKYSTKYYFQVTAQNETQSGSFITGPSSEEKNIKFFVYGDTRTNGAAHDSVAAQIIKEYSKNDSLQSFIISSGDLVANGSREKDWSKQFFNPTYTHIQKMMHNLQYVAALGNHEHGGDLFAKYFPYPFYSENRFYWSFDYGPVHFVILDQFTDYKEGSPQHKWLIKDLGKSKKTWKFIILHKPGWSAGGHKNNEDVQEILQPLCKKYGVDMVLAGHNHYYARAYVDGIYHITTGGGGAPLYDIESKSENIQVAVKAYHFCKIEVFGKELILTAINKNGDILDKFRIQKK